MEINLLENLFEAVKTNKKALKFLKHASVHAQQYEFAATLREFEKENFPETEEDIAAKEKVKDLDLLFRMVEVNAPANGIYKIISAYDLFKKKKGKFDIADAAKIIAKSNELFDDE